jgi:hypothetical protein
VRLLRHILWVDCGAALLAGLAMAALSGWLSALYALPRALLLGMGAVNLGYSAFSGSLARRARRPRALIVVLVAANAAWAVVCALTAAGVAGTASAFGMAHLVGEGMFVATLAALEWRERERLGGAA